MTRRILVQADKKFILTVPDDANLTFGPWSPPNSAEKSYVSGPEAKRGTLRVYSSNRKDILGVFSGVVSFRDMDLGYAEEIAKEEGATIWKDDEKGYYRESKVKRETSWETPALPDVLNEGEN